MYVYAGPLQHKLTLYPRHSDPMIKGFIILGSRVAQSPVTFFGTSVSAEVMRSMQLLRCQCCISIYSFVLLLLICSISGAVDNGSDSDSDDSDPLSSISLGAATLNSGQTLIEELTPPWAQDDIAKRAGGGGDSNKHMNVDPADSDEWMQQLMTKAIHRDYQLHGLEPNARYEARVSYIGTLPYSFTVSLVDGASTEPDSLHPSHSHSASRKLLDVEKVMFSTDENGRTEGCTFPSSPMASSSLLCTSPAVRVSMRFSGVTDRQDVAQQPILYAIVLERLLPGGLPHVAVKVLVLMVFAMVVAYCFLYPYFRRRLIEDEIALGHRTVNGTMKDERTMQRLSEPLTMDDYKNA